MQKKKSKPTKTKSAKRGTTLKASMSSRKDAALASRRRHGQAKQDRHAMSVIRHRRHQQVALQAAEFEGDEMVGAVPMGVYADLRDATAAIDRLGTLQLQEASRKMSFATGLAIGLSIVAVVGIGIVVCYVLLKKKDEHAPEQPVSPLNGTAVPILRTVPAPLEALVQSNYKDSNTQALTELNVNTVIRSYTLPGIESPHPARIATATQVPARVTVRVIAPAGTYAMVAFDVTDLMNIDGAGPPSDAALMFAGDSQEFRLQPRQALFAKGSSSDVCLSVIQANTPADW